MASGCPRSLVQAICRWQTDESINVYTCLGAEQYSKILRAAMAAKIDGARAATLADAAPFIDISDLRRAQVQASPAQLTNAADQIDNHPDSDDDADTD